MDGVQVNSPVAESIAMPEIPADAAAVRRTLSKQTCTPLEIKRISRNCPRNGLSAGAS